MAVLVYSDQAAAQDALDKVLTFVSISRDLPDVSQWAPMEEQDGLYYILAPDRNFNSSVLNPESTASVMPSEERLGRLQGVISSAKNIGDQLIDGFLKKAFEAGVNGSPGLAGQITRVLSQPIQDCQIGALHAAIDNLNVIISSSETGREGLPFTSNAALSALRDQIAYITSQR